ncbi:MAG: NUDIX domain-containing protein [Eubacteriales bacterium]|nr:NUDIX domain-containing protein [Eubacteriales bacterium]
MVEMKYCMQCGCELDEKYLMGEGMVPYCPRCGEFRFRVFSTAVSMIVMNKSLDRVLLIRQYGRKHHILVAGYVNRGEDAEDAVVREIREEIGLEVLEYHFNRSHYFAPSNTLMLNFTVIVEDKEPLPNREIDDYGWFTIEEARDYGARKETLAQRFLHGFFTGTYEF